MSNVTIKNILGLVFGIITTFTIGRILANFVALLVSPCPRVEGVLGICATLTVEDLPGLYLIYPIVFILTFVIIKLLLRENKG